MGNPQKGTFPSQVRVIPSSDHAIFPHTHLKNLKVDMGKEFLEGKVEIRDDHLPLQVGNGGG